MLIVIIVIIIMVAFRWKSLSCFVTVTKNKSWSLSFSYKYFHLLISLCDDNVTHYSPNNWEKAYQLISQKEPLYKVLFFLFHYVFLYIKIIPFFTIKLQSGSEYLATSPISISFLKSNQGERLKIIPYYLDRRNVLIRPTQAHFLQILKKNLNKYNIVPCRQYFT